MISAPTRRTDHHYALLGIPPPDNPRPTTLLGSDREQPPLAGDSLEFVSAAFVELDARPDDEVATVLDTSTISLAPAKALTRAPMCTAIPPMSSPRTSHSPVCNPARTSMPSACTASRIAMAQRIAR